MSVLRLRHGKVYRGDLEVAKSEDEYVMYLMNEDNQEDLIMLQNEVKSKKISVA
jgi:hypothetical protein